MNEIKNTSSSKNEDISLLDLIEKAGPLLKEWQNTEVEKMNVSMELSKEALKEEFKFKKFLIRSLGLGLFMIIALSLYLFVNNKDTIASNLLTITLTGVISFIGGYGLGKSNVDFKD